MFGQRVPAWDSSYYPLMMTQNVPYKIFSKAKWALFCDCHFGFYDFSSRLCIHQLGILFYHFAAGLYNLGVNSYLTLLGSLQ